MDVQLMGPMGSGVTVARRAMFMALRWLFGKGTGTVLKSGRIVQVVEQVDDIAIIAAKFGNNTIEVIANVSKEGGTLFLRKAHIQGASPGAVGVKGLFEMARDLGQANAVSKVVIEGGKRTTGAGKHLGSIRRPITVNIP